MSKGDAARAVRQPLMTNVVTLHPRAGKKPAADNMPSAHEGDVNRIIATLQDVLTWEIVCVLRYSMQAVAAAGLSSEAVKAEFAQHAVAAWGHMMAVAERLRQLGGVPNFNPGAVTTRAASDHGEANSLIDMITENLDAERIAINLYRELVRHFADADPTRVMLERILRVEQAHANALRGLLVDHPLGRDAAIIDDEQRFVQMTTIFGGDRIVDWLGGEQLPQRC